MSQRRQSREWAVQFLFQQDYHLYELDEALPIFWKEREASDQAKAFTVELVRGVFEHSDEIDRLIREHSKHWSPDRMSGVDKNVMRVALFEMLYRPDIPPVVSINEAVDIAKRFGGADSGSFVNGVLDRVASKLKRSLRNADIALEP